MLKQRLLLHPTSLLKLGEISRCSHSSPWSVEVNLFDTQEMADKASPRHPLPAAADTTGTCAVDFLQ
jgi:hypothetical protein